MDGPAIDRAVFAELRDTTGPEFVAELVETFLQEAPGMLAELGEARKRGEAERFRRVAHSLKSNGNTFGALKLAAVARALELNGWDASVGDEPAFTALESEYTRAAAELKALLHG